jgi:hypothetical protein
MVRISQRRPAQIGNGSRIDPADWRKEHRIGHESLFSRATSPGR